MALVCLLSACDAGAGNSPEATFASYLKGVEANDMKRVMSCIDPDRLPVMTLGFLTGAQSFGKSDAKVKSEYEAIQKKHGFGDALAAVNGVSNKADYERTAKEFLRNVSDLPGLCADLYGVMGKYSTAPSDMKNFKGQLTNVKIIEDNAEGVITMPDGKTMPMKFVRRGGSWYINPGW